MACNGNEYAAGAAADRLKYGDLPLVDGANFDLLNNIRFIFYYTIQFERSIKNTQQSNVRQDVCNRDSLLKSPFLMV